MKNFLTSTIGGIDMSCGRVAGVCLLAFSMLCLCIFVVAPVGTCQVAQLPEKAESGQHEQHGQGEHHHLHLPMGEAKCEPRFTYEEGPHGPSHWPGLCNTGKMQAPIDIQHAEKLRIYDLKVNYKPVDLDIIDDCNEYGRQRGFAGEQFRVNLPKVVAGVIDKLAGDVVELRLSDPNLRIDLPANAVGNLEQFVGAKTKPPVRQPSSLVGAV